MISFNGSWFNNLITPLYEDQYDHKFKPKEELIKPPQQRLIWLDDKFEKGINNGHG